MYQFFVDDCQIGKEYVTITGSDVNHIKNVLRMRPGEKIRVSSSSRDMFCEIVELTDDFVQADILDEEAPDTELPSRICFRGCLMVTVWSISFRNQWNLACMRSFRWR